MTINKTKGDTERGATARDLQVLPVDGSELTYEVRGEGPPVLLIHGIAGRIEVWSDIQEALATTHRVIAYDLRGHGRSPNPTPDVRVHAKDAAALIEHAAGEPAIVAGWSSGANVTLQLVDDQPELVKAAVLVESGFHMTRHPVANADVIRTLLGVWRHWLRGRNRAAAERWLRFVFSRRSGGSGWDELDESLREVLLGDEAGMRGELKAAPHQTNGDLAHISAGEAAAWSVPMTYLLAEDSHQMFHNSHGYLTDAAPQMSTIEVPGACHLIPIQQPEAVVTAVRSAVPA